MLRYARLGPTTGMKALVRMLAWKEGVFEFHARLDPVKHPEAPLPLEAAMLDAVRQIDEGNRIDRRRFPLDAKPRVHRVRGRPRGQDRRGGARPRARRLQRAAHPRRDPGARSRDLRRARPAARRRRDFVRRALTADTLRADAGHPDAAARRRCLRALDRRLRPARRGARGLERARAGHRRAARRGGARVERRRAARGGVGPPGVSRRPLGPAERRRARARAARSRGAACARRPRSSRRSRRATPARRSRMRAGRWAAAPPASSTTPGRPPSWRDPRRRSTRPASR